MKRALIVFGLLLFAISGANAQAPKIGVGVYGGLNIPIAMDDQAMGTAYGLKARIKALPVIVVEPYVMFGKWKEPGEIEGIDLGIDGSKITSYGIDITFGGAPGKVGFKPLVVFGAGIYKIKNDDTGFDESKLGFDAGLGFILSVGPQFDIDLRGKLLVAPQEEGSKKAVVALVGINYYIGPGI